MKKSFLMIVLFILVTGCSGMGPSASNVQDDYHTGTQGIVMSFVPNAPPSRVYDGDKLDISVQLENKGAYPEGNKLQGKLEVSGFDPASIRGSWDGGNSMPSDLEGKSQSNPVGGIDVMTYKSSNVNVPFDADYYEPTVLVHSCYKYQTIANPSVCVDADPYEVVEEKKVCTPGTVSVGGGQGAPISVTSVEQEVGSDNLFFRIYISNVGGGSVMVPGAYSDCPFNVEYDELDKVVAKIKLPHDASPDCSPKGTSSDPIRLTGGRGYIFCKFNKPAQKSAYITNLDIVLDYVYSSSISKQIRIINLK